MTGRRLAAIFLAATVVVAAGTFFYFGSATPVAHAKSSPSPSHTASRVSLPMFFEANQGQTDGRVKFLSRGRGYGLFLTADEAVLKLQSSAISHQPSASNVIRMRLTGANSAPLVSGAELLPGKSNYFIGNDRSKWHRNVPQYGRVNYEAVYPGIDLTYYGHQGQLEYDFRVAPGADPNRIALTFDGASTRLESGDLVLATGHGDVRFQAPIVYQLDGGTKKSVTGSFRQLADNKIGFQIGSYDRRRELVIDPSLSYFTYLGGSGNESNVKVGIDSASNIYLAGSTDSAAGFPHTGGQAFAGARDVFIVKLNTSILPPQSQLVYATYVGGTLDDDIAGLAVDAGGLAYLAGITTSTDFPFTPNAFQAAPLAPGTHGFVTKLDGNGVPTYSTYLSGTNGGAPTLDLITGLAIDARGDAFVTGTTTSTDGAEKNFPATPGGFQNAPFLGVSTEFFASKINTVPAQGASSMVYSTYFGGSFPTDPQITGGGIAVDNGGNMYITGATDFIFDSAAPPPPAPRTNFPILNAQQGCLDQIPGTTPCDPNQTAPDAFVAKINPNRVGAVGLVYSTYLGGSKDDAGLGIAVDGAGNAYVTGQTLSDDWTPPTTATPFQTAFANGGGEIVNNHDAFIAKIGNPTQTNTIFPLNYFTYLGGTGDDIGEAIAVDAVGGAHVTGSTNSPDSPDFPVFDPLADQRHPGGANDAFVALIATSQSGKFAGDSVSFLGGLFDDHGQGIVVDVNNTTYVSGTTRSVDFPKPDAPPAPLPFQGTLNPAPNQDDAFLVRIGESSEFIVPPDTPPTVSPNPASLGNQVTFTFTVANNGPDPAAHVIFSGTFPTAGVTFNSASTSPGGTCPPPVNGTVICNVGSVPVNSKVTANVVLTPNAGTTSLNVLPSLSANGGGFVPISCPTPCPIPVPVTDFSIGVLPPSVTINAGESTSFVATLTPLPTYANAISMSDSGLPTASTGTFTSTSVTLSGGSSGTTTLNISTTARPVNTGSLFKGGPMYATWLPIGGISLLGLGIGAGRKRRRWLAGSLLGFIAGLMLLQASCGGSSSSTTSSGGTPAGTYTLTITGSSGSASHNQKVTLIVN